MRTRKKRPIFGVLLLLQLEYSKSPLKLILRSVKKEWDLQKKEFGNPLIHRGEKHF